MALGRLKWSEYEFYTSSPEGFHYACEGYFDERRDTEILFRDMGLITYGVMGGKKGVDIWPMKGVKKQVAVKKVWGSTKEEAMENYKRIMAIHNINYVSKN